MSRMISGEDTKLSLKENVKQASLIHVASAHSHTQKKRSGQLSGRVLSLKKKAHIHTHTRKDIWCEGFILDIQMKGPKFRSLRR